ncbi:28S ribosomal protein S18b, mitochondrial isoform X2 [Nilaparvata lugens]|uniref:28S ribosomal protein S18b, mitochondrial isoform X2 n=1 Tax=Nilaparvata lugens TaxID=108931 RepID=UPI00193DADFF|nr:28S ribosomal protein S18b, mitochondrial isoform X2 [Nilaparvata lugens]
MFSLHSLSRSLLSGHLFFNKFHQSFAVNRALSLSLTDFCEKIEHESKNGDDEIRDPSKDRTKVIPVETSVRYMNSKAYQMTYGDEPVWVKYRRNFKGQFAPKETRKTCIRKGQIATGNPCPICRDEYLVPHETNVKLLQQFISPYNGNILKTSKTGVCRKQHIKLEIAIERAKDQGLITFDVPFRTYNYSDYNIKV